MAKLEGVKVLDMKYGEILRVEYNGEIYEKVDGPAQKGDLLRVNVEGLSDVDKGDFFEVGNRGRYYDNDEGERDANFSWPAGYLSYFRKISVQPSLADRVAAVEAKLNDLSSRVDKFDGKTDEEISASLNKKERPTEGDFVKIIQKGISHAKIGEYVKIVEDDKSDTPFKCEDLNGWNVGWFREDEVEKVTDENVLKFLRAGRKPNEYKVGDLIQITKYEGGAPVGSIREVREVYNTFVLYSDLYGAKFDAIKLVAPVEARVDRP
jgi:hypothetical protein